ncbi:HAD-IIB family hydrolase [Zhihengliuella halotolerans]|uniref:HAD-IIB family hydrolase n=1 Tax=Zhihengliuella halotolerans TaxID=370736 RepID=UPI000C80E20B|nr:HAD-IIB family hydrolase [Zhihengliuella halotolerans]
MSAATENAKSHTVVDESARAVFLDVDGTYADHGVVPDGHVRAVRAARAAGHKVLLCTGRPLSMLDDEILGAGFDGVVASAGAHVKIGGEVLLDRRFPAGLAARTVEVLDVHDAVYILEAQEALHAPPAAMERLREIIEEHFRHSPSGAAAILGALRPVADLAAVPFAKVSVFASPVPMSRLLAEIGEGVAVVENSIAAEGRHSGELYLHGISKADGLAAAIEHLNIPREHSIAVGDGENDLEMVAYAGIGVAIEGSSPQLTALADRTAAPPREEGLVAAFAELGLS